jgi:hypothetical protein
VEGEIYGTLITLSRAIPGQSPNQHKKPQTSPRTP